MSESVEELRQRLGELEQRLRVQATELQAARARGVAFSEVNHLYDTTPVGLCLLDTELRFVRINDKLAEISGYPKDEHIGRKLRELLPELADDIEPIHRQVIATGRAVTGLKLRGRTRAAPDSDRVWLASYHPLKDEAGSVEGVGTVIQDITELKQAEQALRKSEVLLSALVNHAPVVLWAIDRKGRFTLSSGKGLQAIGLKPGEVVGQSLFEMYADYPDIVASARRALAGESFSITTEVGDSVFENRYAPSLDEQGEIAGAFGVSIDVTDRRRAEAERRRIEEQMRQAQKLESLGILAGGIAHDFNNLLMGILGNAGLALKEMSPTSRGAGHVRRIETAAVRAAELTNQMLAYSGRGTFVIEPIDLNELVEEMAHLLRTVISKKAELSFQFASELPAVEADPSQLRQVVMNLLTNASDALGDGEGTIALRTTLVELDEAKLAETDYSEATPGSRYICLDVADTGVGMSEETRARLFDPFYTTKFTGRGLGLAAVLGIVRSHKGAIQVESRPGGGTTFRLFFPCSEAAPARSSETAVAAAPGGRSGETILVVDDDVGVLTVVRLLLKSAGFKVLTAADGKQGVEAFRANRDRVSLVLLDLTMPGLRGDEVFEQIQQIRPDVPVILSSGYSQHEATRRFADRGLSGFIQKPYSGPALEQAIEQVLGPRG